MAYVQFAYIKCPMCTMLLDMNIMSVKSLLGPPAVRCPKCATTVAIERMEWRQMDGRARSWFVGVSVLYGALAYLFGGMSTNEAAHLLATGRRGRDWAFDEPSFQIGGAAWVAAVLLIQVFRVCCSLLRTDGEGDQEPARRIFFTFDVLGHLKFMILMLLIPFVWWALHFVLKP